MDQRSQCRKICAKHLCIQSRVLRVTMHRSFGTAHSLSAGRDNFIVRLSHKDSQSPVCGYGECGLPPKKRGCYPSDISDCFSFINDLQESLSHTQHAQSPRENMEKVFSGITQNYLVQSVMGLQQEWADDIMCLLTLISQTQQQRYSSPKSAVEFAILDFCAKSREMSLQEFVHGKVPSEHPIHSFYSVSLEDRSAMLQNARQHLGHTRCLKFKFNNHIKPLLELIQCIMDEGLGDTLIIDANCSWSVEDYREFEHSVERINGFIDKLLFIEQPFDQDVDDIERWASVKKSTKMRILADESFRSGEDVPKIAKVAHAVNIKTEKTGGLLGALRAAHKVKQAGLDLMFGTMVTTQLGCSQTYVLAPLAKYIDADGSLLVKDPVIQGGFRWGQNGKIEPDFRGYGLGVDTRILEDWFRQQ